MNQIIELQSFNYVPLQQSLSRDIVLNKMVGTHFFGSFKGLSFTQLTELFGTPIKNEYLPWSDETENKDTRYQWLIEFEDGLLATIYDWKVDYKKSSVWTDSSDIEWHVGGHDPRVMDRVYKLTKLDEQMTFHEAIVTMEKAMLMMKSRNVPFNYDRLNIAWSKIQRGV
tara:strand:+ start:25 stop:531 length:507 start_codon:yes stop_codon:yes gene_type:complete